LRHEALGVTLGGMAFFLLCLVVPMVYRAGWRKGYAAAQLTGAAPGSVPEGQAAPLPPQRSRPLLNALAIYGLIVLGIVVFAYWRFSQALDLLR